MGRNRQTTQSIAEEGTFVILFTSFILFTSTFYSCNSALLRNLESCKYRRCWTSEEREEINVESVKRKPIPPQQFLTWLRRRDASKDLNLEVKALLNHRPDAQCKVSTASVNLWLNNQKDIVPYDHARISLQEIPQGFTTDYINANYIDGFCKSKEYIATQGPQYRIASAFWQMVWQEQVRCIVMATGLFEHATQQCDKYWEDIVNDYGQVKHGKITIRTINTVSIAHLTIRTLQICKEGDPGCRIIEHFEMSSWEMDDTIDAGVILDSRRRILKYMDSSSGPLLVHCRSGGARTAIFVAVDYCLKQLEVEDYVDVFGAILHMHNSRKNMIRTPVQYRLIYDTLALYMQCSNSIYTVSSLVQRLSEQETNLATEFQEEFQVLNQVVPKLSIGDCAGGHRQENRSKSRDIMLQPPERARPYLLSNDKSDDSDFINGVYVDGYWNRNNYIVTQWPMKSTIRDIWRLVYDYKVHTMVLLNDVKFSRGYPCFWPKDVNQEKKYGPIGVKYCRTFKYPDMAVRLFRVRKSCVTLPPRDMKDESRPVRMFQLLNWPKSNKVPPNTMSFAYLLGLVEEWQTQTNSNSPIVVISKDGYSRCGMFSAISICCDRLKEDREVDIMNAVRVVKKNRPQLIPTLAEYNYCYTFIGSLLEHLQEIGPTIVVTNPEGGKESDHELKDPEEGTDGGEEEQLQQQQQQQQQSSSRRTSESSSFFTALDTDTPLNLGQLTQFHSSSSSSTAATAAAAWSPLHLAPCDDSDSAMNRHLVVVAASASASASSSTTATATTTTVAAAAAGAPQAPAPVVAATVAATTTTTTTTTTAIITTAANTATKSNNNTCAATMAMMSSAQTDTVEVQEAVSTAEMTTATHATADNMCRRRRSYDSAEGSQQQLTYLKVPWFPSAATTATAADHHHNHHHHQQPHVVATMGGVCSVGVGVDTGVEGGGGALDGRTISGGDGGGGGGAVVDDYDDDVDDDDDDDDAVAGRERGRRGEIVGGGGGAGLARSAMFIERRNDHRCRIRQGSSATLPLRGRTMTTTTMTATTMMRSSSSSTSTLSRSPPLPPPPPPPSLPRPPPPPPVPAPPTYSSLCGSGYRHQHHHNNNNNINNLPNSRHYNPHHHDEPNPPPPQSPPPPPPQQPNRNNNNNTNNKNQHYHCYQQHRNNNHHHNNNSSNDDEEDDDHNNHHHPQPQQHHNHNSSGNDHHKQNDNNNNRSSSSNNNSNNNNTTTTNNNNHHHHHHSNYNSVRKFFPKISRASLRNLRQRTQQATTTVLTTTTTTESSTTTTTTTMLTQLPSQLQQQHFHRHEDHYNQKQRQHNQQTHQPQQQQQPPPLQQQQQQKQIQQQQQPHQHQQQIQLQQPYQQQHIQQQQQQTPQQNYQQQQQQPQSLTQMQMQTKTQTQTQLQRRTHMQLQLQAQMQTQAQTQSSPPSNNTELRHIAERTLPHWTDDTDDDEDYARTTEILNGHLCAKPTRRFFTVVAGKPLLTYQKYHTASSYPHPDFATNGSCGLDNGCGFEFGHIE